MRKILITLFICGLCVLSVGCAADKTSKSDDTDTVNVSAMKDGLPKLSELEPAVDDNLPESIGRETQDMTAKELSFDMEISSPAVLLITCVTESGKLDMKITDDDGQKIFEENDIPTEDFTVDINSSGTYKVIIQAEKHTGSFWITPKA